jgi:hypothetical protein
VVSRGRRQGTGRTVLITLLVLLIIVVIFFTAGYVLARIFI